MEGALKPKGALFVAMPVRGIDDSIEDGPWPGEGGLLDFGNVDDIAILLVKRRPSLPGAGRELVSS